MMSGFAAPARRAQAAAAVKEQNGFILLIVAHGRSRRYNVRRVDVNSVRGVTIPELHQSVIHSLAPLSQNLQSIISKHPHPQLATHHTHHKPPSTHSYSSNHQSPTSPSSVDPWACVSDAHKSSSAHKNVHSSS